MPRRRGRIRKGLIIPVAIASSRAPRSMGVGVLGSIGFATVIDAVDANLIGTIKIEKDAPFADPKAI